ncbi:transferase [Candidatus Gottesmanbacteria bacterium]|nr:transferase [Candidatus Gottesmanbacteria bacterium]
MISNNKIYKRVSIGKGGELGDFLIIGIPAEGIKDGQFQTIIGNSSQIRSHTVIYSANKIGNNFQTGHGVLIREKNQIGDDVSVGSHSTIEHHVKIGNKVRIHSNTFIPEYTIIKDKVWIGPCVVITNAYHPNSKPKCLKGVTIKSGAIIGANVTLLPGIIIGDNSFIGAGSVVTQNVPNGEIHVGNPNRKIHDRKELICPFCKSMPYR